MKVTLLSYTPEPEKLVAMAAKLCYSNEVSIESLDESLEDKGKVARFVRKLMSMHHYSPLEHVSFTFGIEGCSRSFLAQISRHRLASFSVRSQRYCEEDSARFVEPSAIHQDELARDEFRIAMESAWSSYNELRNLGMEKEDARAVLPNACATRMIVTMNARELLHFFSLRCCTRSQQEIRRVAEEMLLKCKEVAPTIFENSGASCVQFGFCPEGRNSCGRKPTLEDLKKFAKQYTASRADEEA